MQKNAVGSNFCKLRTFAFSSSVGYNCCHLKIDFSPHILFINHHLHILQLKHHLKLVQSLLIASINATKDHSSSTPKQKWINNNTNDTLQPPHHFTSDCGVVICGGSVERFENVRTPRCPLSSVVAHSNAQCRDCNTKCITFGQWQPSTTADYCIPM